MPNATPDEQRLPEFDAAFRDSSPFFYFHHIIDPVAATLRVEVIGPNLSYTFRHERARALRPASDIAKNLERKTAGFLALVTEGGNRRIVLAWAESGHGVSRSGDLLDAGPSVLANDLWTKRVVAMGKLLSMRMRRPFDGRASLTAGRDMAGVFLGAHVEVKLAVHAIFVLLSIFNITQDWNNVSRRHLRMLRHARWEDGTIPAFEIYFSRKNCWFCGALVKNLESITGVSIKLIWRERLVKVVYEKRPLKKGPQPNQPRPQQERALGESSDQDEDEIEDDETLFGDDVQPVDYIDLTGDHSHQPRSRNNGPDLAEIINLIDDEEQIIIDDDSDSSRSISPPPPSDQQQQRLAVDEYIDGLAYCVGQIDQCPQGAQTAIIEFAEAVSKQHNRTARRAPAPKNHQAWANINKPLPATPVTEPPPFMIKPAGPAEAAQVEASSAGGSQEEQKVSPVKEAPTGQLPTPPTSEVKPESQKVRARFPERHDRNRSKSPSELHERHKQTDAPSAQVRQRSPRRYSFRGGEQSTTGDDARRARGASIRVEIPARRRASPSPDPF